jgi:hypothetical protein
MLQGFTQLLGFLPRMKPTTETPDPVDFMVFISPEYFEKETAVSVITLRATQLLMSVTCRVISST